MDVKTAGRTVDLFDVFAKAQTPLTLSEVARALDAPQSSCFNLVRALEARGYLYSVGGKKRLYPTRKLLDVASAIANYDPVVPRFQPTLELLRDKTEETTILGTQQGNRVVYLAVAEGIQTIRYISRVGELKPMHSSAIGKALLSKMPPKDREKLIGRLPKPEITPSTITSDAALIAEIDAAEAQGYAITKGENVVDVMAVAVPFELEGIFYAIAVAGPLGRLKESYRQHAATAQALIAQL